ncbi:MAG: magnesium transporter [Armatimonadota bacterium]|nr:magnesium transporter [Armatimonadota bacterium]MDW8157202.1 magnesium transporter [Armatimonadota bacterium]
MVTAFLDPQTVDFERLRSLSSQELANFLLSLDPPALAQLVTRLGQDAVAELVAELDSHDAARLILKLGRAQAADVLEEMPPDDAADVLEELAPQEAETLLTEMEKDRARALKGLLAYPEGTAGSLMTPEFIAVSSRVRVADAIDLLREVGHEVELPYYVYVVDARGRLEGVVSLRDLVVAPPEAPVREVMRTDVVWVRPEADREEAARLVQKYDLLALPVCDADRRLLGIITADDILRVAEEEGTEDVLGAAGGTAPKGLGGLLSWRWVGKRAGFLAFNLVLNVLAAVVISRFQSTLERAVSLAFFFPLLAATAGNVGTQSLAVAVRGMATRVFQAGDWGVVRREAVTGFFVGLVCGSLACAVAWLWLGDSRLALVVGAAMWVSLMVAAAVGVLVPFGFALLRFDPAIGSGPLITTITDNVSLSAYLLLASFLLGVVA